MYQSGMHFIIILKRVGTHTHTCTYTCLRTHIHKRGNGYSSCISSHTSQCMLLKTRRLCSFQGQLNEWLLSVVEWYWRKLQYLDRNVSQCHSSHKNHTGTGFGMNSTSKVQCQQLMTWATTWSLYILQLQSPQFIIQNTYSC